MKQNLFGTLLLLASLALLIPGLTMDIMTLNISIPMPLFGNQTIHEETRSIVGTIGVLFQKGNVTVASLILLFSVVVPFLKTAVLTFILVNQGHQKSAAMHKFVGIISKWAMADVFVVGVFIAFLTTKTDDNIQAFLHTGFYLFAGYCILSTLAVQFIKVPEKQVVDASL